MTNCQYLSSLCVMFGHVTILALLLISGHTLSAAESDVSETISSPDSASSPLSPSLLSSSSRQKRAPVWGKRTVLEQIDDGGFDADTIYSNSVLYDDGISDKRAPGWAKRAPGWGKRAPGWGKRAPGWGKRAPGWGKRAPGWGKRSLAAENFIDEEEDNGRFLSEFAKRAPGWGKRAPGWGKRAPGWGKRAPGWGKRAPGWGKRAPGWGKRSRHNICQDLRNDINEAKILEELCFPANDESNEEGRN